MRAAAVDLGKVRVGLAVADELGLMAHPRQYLDGRDPRRVVGELTRLAEAEGITLFLVGLPLALSRSRSPRRTVKRSFRAARCHQS